MLVGRVESANQPFFVVVQYETAGSLDNVMSSRDFMIIISRIFILADYITCHETVEGWH